MNIEEYANSLIAKGVSEDEFVTLMQDFSPNGEDKKEDETDPPKKDETATEDQDANVDTDGTASDGEEVSSGIQEDVYIQTFEVPEYEPTELLDEEGEVETTIETIEAPVVSFMKSHDQELIEDQNLTLKSINRVKPTEGAITSVISEKEELEKYKNYLSNFGLKFDEESLEVQTEHVLIEVTNPELAENLPGAELVTEGQYKGFYRIPREVLPEKGYEYVNIYTNEQGEEVKGSPYEVSTAVTEVDDLMNGKYLSKETSENPGFIPEVEINDQTVIRSSEYYTKRLEEIHEKLQNKDLTDEERKNLLVSQSVVNGELRSSIGYFQTLTNEKLRKPTFDIEDQEKFDQNIELFFGLRGEDGPKGDFFYRRLNRKGARDLASLLSEEVGGYNIDFSYMENPDFDFGQGTDLVIAGVGLVMDQDDRLGQIDYIATINKAVDNGLVLTKENFTGNSSRIFNEETGKVETEFLTDPERGVILNILKENGLVKTFTVGRGYLNWAGKLGSYDAELFTNLDATKKEAEEMAEFIKANKGEFSLDKQFNIVDKSTDFFKTQKVILKESKKLQKEYIKNINTTLKELQEEVIITKDTNAALKITEDQMKLNEQNANDRITSLEKEGKELNEEFEGRAKTYQIAEEQLKNKISQLQKEYQGKINSALTRSEQEMLNEEFKSKQEVILNEFQPTFDDYKLAVDSYNENITGLQEQKKDVESLLNTYQEEFEEYEKERLNAQIQQEKSNEIYFKFRETAANLQALTDMTTLQNNNIAMLADQFQKNQENAVGQGNKFDALYNRFIEDVSKTMSGRVLSMSQIPFYFLQAEKNLKQKFGNWTEADQRSYDYYMSTIKVSQVEAMNFDKVFVDAFEDKATDQEYMQAYANTFVGGVLNTVVTMYATQIGMGVFVGINPFSSGISKGLMNIPKAVFSKAGTINAINLGRGFYNLSMASSYEVLDQQKEKYLNSKTQAYIKSGLSQAAATRKARQDYNQATNYGAANQTYMTARASVEGLLEFVTGKILQGGGKYSKAAVDKITGWVIKRVPKGRYSQQQLASKITELVGPKISSYLATGGKLFGMGSEETITELFQEGSGIGIDAFYQNMTGIEMELPDIGSESFRDEMKHLASVAFGSAIFLGGYGAVQQGKRLRFQTQFNEYISAYRYKEDMLEAQSQVFRLTDDAAIDLAKDHLKNQWNNNELTDQEYQDALTNLDKQVKAYKSVNNPKYNARAQVDMANIQMDINEIENKLKSDNISEADRAALKEELKALKEEQIDISQDETALAEFDGEKAFGNITEAAEQLAEITGAKITTVSSKEDVADVAASLGEDIKAYDVNGKEMPNLSDGMFLTDGTNIIINEEIAKNVGNISAATHEIFHKILQNQFGNDVVAKEELVKQFKNNLSNAELGIIQARLDKQYSGENSTTEEYFNAFHDALVAGEIKFSAGKFGKLGDFVTDKILRPAGFTNAQFGFATGKQAYNFLKEYSKQTREIAKGTRTEFDEKITDVIKDLPEASTSSKPSDIVESNTIKETLDNIVQNPDGTRKFETKEQFQQEGLGEAWLEISKEGTEKDPNIFEGTIAKIGVESGVPVNALPDFITKVKQRLQEKMMGATERGGFDPAKNESLFGYFFGKNRSGQSLVQLATGDVANAFKKAPKGVSLDAPTQQGTTREMADVSQDAQALARETEFVAPKSKLRRQLKLPGDARISPAQIKELEALAAEVLKDKRLQDPNAKDYRKKFMDIAGKKAKAWVNKNIVGGSSRQAYTDFLTDNIAALFGGKNLSMKYLIAAEREVNPKDKIFTKFDRKLTTQADIRKFKNSGDVFVVNEAQGVNKYDRLKPKPFQVRNFYIGNQTPQNVTNKKGKLLEDIGASLLMDITPQTGKKEKIPQAKRSKIAEQLQRNPELLFSNTINLTPQQLVGQVTFDGKPVQALPGKSNNRWVMTTAERQESEEFLRSIAQYFPEEFFTTGNFGFSSRALFGIPEGGSHKGNINRILKGVSFNNNAPKPPVRYEYQSGKKLDESIYKKLNTKAFKENEKRKLPFLKYVFKTIEKDVKKNPKHAKFWEAIIRDATNSQSHFNRAMAPIAFLVKPGYKGEIVEEHSLPQKLVGQFLLNSAFNGTVDQDFKFIENNYFQGALKKIDDDKLKDPKGILTGSKYNYQQKMPDFHTFELETWIRYINENVNKNLGGINTNDYILTNEGITLAERFDVNLTQQDIQNIGSKTRLENIMPDIVTIQNNIIELVLKGTIDAKQARDIFTYNMSLIPGKVGAKNSSTISLTDSKVLSVNEQTMTQEELLSKAMTIDKALANARKLNQPVKKIRVFDFDDTLATSKNIVIAKKDGKEMKLNAEEFAKRGLDLKEDGWVMDFSDFNKVTDGGRGPLFKVAEAIKNARGNEDLYVLTARAPESADAIYEFLKSEGLEFKRENIIGLGNSTGEAKANWIIDRAADGYNDFYFADDAYQNVRAVQDALSVIDVKSKVQQAMPKLSSTLNLDFNKIIENKTGIGAEKIYSKAKAQVRGANKGRFKFAIPYSAEDFVGLMYPLLGKGKVGDAQMAWMKVNLLDPYNRAMQSLSQARLNIMNDFKALKKTLNVPKSLKQEAVEGYTNEQAVRVYIWNKMGYDIPNMSKSDIRELTNHIENSAELQVFADQVMLISKDGYVKPNQDWLVGTITTDFIRGLNTDTRSKYLEQWQQNVDAIFTEAVFNKLEAAYGAKYVEALKNILGRMKSGSNRSASSNRLSNRILDYINNSTGAIMFFNTRSAVLQTISAANFVNWTFNNPYQAGKAFANQKQYWKDFMTLMNSDYLVDRRNGQRINISESEIANAAATAKNKARAALNYILTKGYLPTQYADSFAIASGGATFYRNRINDLLSQTDADGKRLYNKEQAERIALDEFRAISEESQQSSDPSKISQQQASDYGRIILAFANTPMQYARLQKRAIQDLANGRGDAKSHISKILYYGFVQNLMFNALQQAVFALGFGDDDDDEKKQEKYLDTANGMLDSLLRGLGIGGATLSVVKNFLLDIYERSGRRRPEYVDSVWKLIQISPPISSKISKMRQAAWNFDSKKRRQEMFDKGFSLDNPAYESAAKVISAVTNLPLDRVLLKIDNLQTAFEDDTEFWQMVAMLAGWPAWLIKPEDKKKKDDKIKIGTKSSIKVGGSSKIKIAQ